MPPALLPSVWHRAVIASVAYARVADRMQAPATTPGPVQGACS